MATKLQTTTSTIALAILLSGLLACKMFKKQEDDESPVASASAEPASSKASAKPEVKEPEPKQADAPKLGDVKRFKDKEKEVEGVVKVLERNVKVFNEPDIKTPHVAELNKDIFVNRLATLDDFTLVEFPSGVGELSPGWVESKLLSDPDAKVSQEKVKAQESAAKVVTKKDPEPSPTETAKETEKASAETKETEKAATETKQETEKAATETKETEKTQTEKTAETTKEEPKKDSSKTVVEKVSRKKR